MTTDAQSGTAGPLAVMTDTLPLDRLSLIGVYEDASGGSALLRTADGAILRVRPGETQLGMTIIAVQEGGLYLTDKTGSSVVLRLP